MQSTPAGARQLHCNAIYIHCRARLTLSVRGTFYKDAKGGAGVVHRTVEAAARRFNS